MKGQVVAHKLWRNITEPMLQDLDDISLVVAGIPADTQFSRLHCGMYARVVKTIFTMFALMAEKGFAQQGKVKRPRHHRHTQ